MNFGLTSRMARTMARHGLYPELIEVLAANYQPELQIGLFQIFRYRIR